MGEVDVGLGGVADLGTHEEDGPVTREALVSPQSSLGDAERRTMTPKARAEQVLLGGEGTKSTCAVVGLLASEERSVWPKGARESEGCVRAMKSGNARRWTRRSKGGPCGG